MLSVQKSVLQSHLFQKLAKGQSTQAKMLQHTLLSTFSVGNVPVLLQLMHTEHGHFAALVVQIIAEEAVND